MKSYIYLYRREIERGAFKTWEYQYVDIKATELPPTPAGFKLFTITPVR